VRIAACHAQLKASDDPMTRVAPEPFPPADEPVEEAVPASSLSTVPGAQARAPSDGSLDEIAPAAEVSPQLQASMRQSPPPRIHACLQKPASRKGK
jgi:hypothetical protein